MNGDATPSTSSNNSASLQQQVDSLRKILTLTLAVLLCFVVAMDLYLARQVANVRKALEANQAIVDQYTKTQMPNIQAFVSKLQTFAKTHPDLNPILARYNMLPRNEAAPVAPTK